MFKEAPEDNAAAIAAAESTAKALTSVLPVTLPVANAAEPILVVSTVAPVAAAKSLAAAKLPAVLAIVD